MEQCLAAGVTRPPGTLQTRVVDSRDAGKHAARRYLAGRRARRLSGLVAGRLRLGALVTCLQARPGVRALPASTMAQRTCCIGLVTGARHRKPEWAQTGPRGAKVRARVCFARLTAHGAVQGVRLQAAAQGMQMEG